MSIFYLIFIGLAAYYSLRYDGMEEYDQHKQHRLWLLCFYLICLTGFSYGLGGDKFVYMQEFEEYPDQFSEAGDFIWIQLMLKGQMPLWTLLNLFAKVTFHSFYAVQLIQSAIVNLSICYIASKYTHRVFLFLLIYFFTLQYFVFNTEIMREGIALAFTLIGMHGWLSGRRWLFFVMFPIGLLFHVSAVTALVFLFSRSRISWKSLLLSLFVSFSIWVLSDLLLYRVMIAVLGGMGALVEKVLFYSMQASTIFGFLRSALTYLVFPFIIMYTALSYETDEEQRRRKEQMIAFMLLLGILACSFAGFVRLYNYSRVFYLILFADFLYMLPRSKEHFILRSGTLVCTAFLLLLQYLIPYKTTGTHYFDFFYPYTCILHEDKSVYFREIAHTEAVLGEESDKNVRDLK